LVKGLKVYTDTDHDLDTFEEIDAIALHGTKPPSKDCSSNGIPDECDRDLGGDWNNDQFIDLVDHSFLIDCLAGPGSVPGDLECFDLCLAAFDNDHDGDVDLIDYQWFQQAFTWRR
jgi:hypothetical protein